MKAWLLGSGGWISTAERATTSVLVREGGRALVVDAGTGLHRLVTEPALLAGAERLDLVLTHFHLDHVAGLAYLPALDLPATVWGPGVWLYGADSGELLAPLLEPPLSPFGEDELPEIRELREGRQQIAGLALRTRAQPRHWAPTAGIRIGDALAVVTDTGYDERTAELAAGVGHLLHEAWSSSSAPASAEHDSTGADAGQAAAQAGARALTLIHLNPRLEDHQPVLRDARATFPAARLGRDGLELL
ncbi:MAG TPA: MBL fold metallo-hydrolase [Gaiellaceae bacterium]|jgi:ribonuclease BN (tRNA processing enzyme)|nr:MBL fold metallo-hydrolase [Gaiellaceae bacterium]